MSAIRRTDGFTLLEVLISMTIAVMIAVLLGKVTIDGLTRYQYLQFQATASANLSNLLDRVGRVIRGASSIVTANSNTITFYGYFSPQDAVVDQVTYTVSGTTLQASVIPPTGTAPNYTYNSANAVVTTLTTNLTTSPNPIFTYYDDAGNQLANGFTTQQVKQVGIFLSINPGPHYLPKPVSTGTRITLRNMKTNL